MFTWNVTKTTFMSLTASLEELLYFWMDLFFCKKSFVKVVASFSRKKNGANMETIKCVKFD